MFRFEDDKTIDDAWAKLKEYKRKVTSVNNNLKSSYSDEALFLILINALPTAYEAIIDGFAFQQSLTVDEKLKILSEKED